MVAAVVVDMAAVDMAAVVDTSALDTLWPPPSHLDTSRLHTLRPDMLSSDLDPVRTSRLDIGAMNTSLADTAAISGTAVGGITALARAGGGRTFTASTFGCAIKAPQSRRRSGGALRLAAFTTFRSMACRIPAHGQVCPRCGRPRRPERCHVYRTSRSADRGDPSGLR
jgi:hypothetical protein